jgi:UDP-N-acetylmuramyl tripeptide synthase
MSKHGGGSAGPGYYALKIYPQLVSKLAIQIPQNVAITGTNGKTTTARLLSHFVNSQSLKIIRNATGSNLERGIASTLIAHSSWLGKIEADIGIWELDEAAFNTVVFDLKPQIIVFLNAFRDQLDRYGEVDTVVKKWHKSLEKIDWQPAIVVNSGDNHTWSLVEQNSGSQIADSESKRRPISDMRYAMSFYEFRVKDYEIFQEKKIISKRRRQDDFIATITKNHGLEGLEFDLKFSNQTLKIKLPIPGIYHIYDFLAAFSVYYLLNLPLEDINAHLQKFLPAFGRVEKIKLKNLEAYIFLIKNPAGATSVFETLAPEIKSEDRLLIALNDNFADGKDVSWIWDIDLEKFQISNFKFQIICSGSRAQDLALRLKYAGVDPIHLKVENDLEKALFEAQTGLSGKLFILPTYTALLELQKLLAKHGLKKQYWQEA